MDPFMQSVPSPSLPPTPPEGASRSLPKIIIIILFVITIVCVAVIYFFQDYWAVQYQKLTKQQEDAVALMSVGASYDDGDIDRAIAGAELLVSQNNADIEALLLLATTYAQKGSVTFNEDEYATKAIEAANRVLALKSDNNKYNSEAYRIIGYSNEIMGKYSDARLNYDGAIKLDALNSQAYSNKGHSYDLEGDLENAAIWYDKALAVDRANEHALLNKARLLVRGLKFDESKAALNVLFTVSQNKRMLAEGYQLLGFIEMNTDGDGYYDEAYDAL